MLKKENRLKKKTDFDWVFKNSRPLFLGNLAIRSAPRRRQKGEPEAALLPPRFGFVISNKIEKRAVRRNALKRALRSAASAHLKETKNGLDIIVVAKRNYPYPYDRPAIIREAGEAIKKTI